MEEETTIIWFSFHQSNMELCILIILTKGKMILYNQNTRLINKIRFIIHDGSLRHMYFRTAILSLNLSKA